MRRSELLAAVVLSACSRSPEPATVDPAPPPNAIASSSLVDGAMAAVSVDAAAPLHVVAVSVASFAKGNVLDQCVDYKLSSLRTPDAGADPEGQLAGSLLATMKTKTNELTRVYKPCDQQFQTRGELAHCVLHSTQQVPSDPEAGAGLPAVDAGTFDIDVVLHYYDLKTLETDDATMKQCLVLKGDWQGLDKKSDAYQEAVRARGRSNER